MTESSDPATPAAFSYPGHGPNARIGIAICHGFTGSPLSILPWAEYLAKRGFAVSVPFLELSGVVLGGWLMAKSGALAAERLRQGGDREFLQAKVQTTRFYADQLLPRAHALARIVKAGAASVVEAEPALL